MPKVHGADDRATQACTGKPRSEGGRRRRRWGVSGRARAGSKRATARPCARSLPKQTGAKRFDRAMLPR